MEASYSAEHSLNGAGAVMSVLVPPTMMISSSSSSSSSVPVRNGMKNSPYVGWFRHAPPSSSTTTASAKKNYCPLVPKNNSCYSSHTFDDKNIHRVDPEFIKVQLDRWHETLSLLLNDHSTTCNASFSSKYPTKNKSLDYDVDPYYPQLHEIINGRLVGGSGKHDHRNRRGLADPATTTTTAPTAIKVLARLTSWFMMFPLICEEDDVSLCEKANRMKHLTNTERTYNINYDGAEDSEEEDDDETDSDIDDNDDDSSVSSASISDLPSRNPAALHQSGRGGSERDFSEMNLSVSEIAEAYYAHQLLDEERRNKNNNIDGDGNSGPSSSSIPPAVPTLDHRLDYEITQMDIARMARNASRHLDVDSILNLPTVTYQSRATQRKQRQMMSNAAGRTDQSSYHHVCSPVHNDSSSNQASTTREDGWSFVMIQTTPPRSSETNQRQSSSGDNNEDVCVICLEAFRDGDRLRVLPCDHSFHVGCIDRWLSGSHSYNECYTAGCPTCKKRPSAATANDETPQQRQDDDEDELTVASDHPMDGSVPSWAFAKLGSAMAMSQGF